MPKREDITSVLVIGSGPIVIGQACEFDYSGTQACRVLREEGVRVILVNSNPATIMTDPDFADATYVEPITWEVIETIIAKEKPDAILPTLGGQTALNAAIQLHEHGILEKYDVELIGASFEAINKGEDRQIFKELVIEAGADVARSHIATTLDEAKEFALDLGYPLVVRPSFTMGGLGSGFAYNEADLVRIAGQGIHDSPTHEVLLEESILGWKEYELELMRDTADNTVVVCSIENVDPVGVHTGDSITVAPALTLTDREYQKLRDIGIDIIRAVGVDTGGCNIQFAIDPADGRIIVIEMNPRVSRSSALASKATGFPIAKIAAKLAIGYRLDEIPNDITRVTPASFEPTLDYVVVKVPRFAFEKFPAADPTLTTTMKSVGEAMAIGRNYASALQKALRSLEKKGSSFHWGEESRSLDELLEISKTPTDGRIVTVQQALRAGASVEQVFDATKIDPWFIDQIVLINEVADAIAARRHPRLRHAALREGPRLLRRADRRAARLRRGRRARGAPHPRRAPGLQDRRHLRRRVPGAHAVPLLELRRGDRGGPERPPQGRHPRLRPEPHRPGRRVRLLLRARLVRPLGRRLRDDHDQLQPRDGLDRLRHQRQAVLRAAHAGGRARGHPRRVAVRRARRRRRAARRPDRARPREGPRRRPASPILGTTPEAIDLAEERGEFSRILDEANLLAPRNGTAYRRTRAPSPSPRRSATRCWCARATCSAAAAWRSSTTAPRSPTTSSASRARASSARRIRCSSTASSTTPSRSTSTPSTTASELYIGGVMEHIEEAGIHSGDSSCTLPPVTLGRGVIDRVREATEAIAQGIGVRGLLNVQFAIGAGVLYVLEANPRASRTVPFVAKALGIPLAKAASLIMVGRTIAELKADGMLPEVDGSRVPFDSPVAVKEAVLPVPPLPHEGRPDRRLRARPRDALDR